MMSIAVFSLLMEAALAWPITPINEYSRTTVDSLRVDCGDFLMLSEELDQEFDVIYSPNTTDGTIPAGCEIEVRLGLKDNSIEDYGYHVKGFVDVSSPDSRSESCGSNYLELDDVDDDTDPNKKDVKFCNQQNITYATDEDILRIIFKVGENGAKGNGFHLRLTPHYVCGGLINDTHNYALQTPEFPQSYPRDTMCLWNIRASKGNVFDVTFEEFDLKPKSKKRGCLDSMRAVFGGKNTMSCGNKLEDLPRITGQTNAVIVFRSDNKNNRYTGFKAHVKFRKQKKDSKDLLMAKFFK